MIVIAKFRLLRDCQSSGNQCWRDFALKQNSDENFLVVKLKLAIKLSLSNPSFEAGVYPITPTVPSRCTISLLTSLVEDTMVKSMQ